MTTGVCGASSLNQVMRSSQIRGKKNFWVHGYQSPKSATMAECKELIMNIELVLDPGGRGDSHITKTGVLIGKFVKNP